MRCFWHPGIFPVMGAAYPQLDFLDEKTGPALFAGQPGTGKQLWIQDMPILPGIVEEENQICQVPLRCLAYFFADGMVCFDSTHYLVWYRYNLL